MNTNINNEDSPQKLVGRKVNLIVTEHESKIGEKVFKFKQYEVVDPEFENDVNNINSDNRILPPDTGATMDYKPFRLNVYIDEQGIVTQVNNG